MPTQADRRNATRDAVTGAAIEIWSDAGSTHVPVADIAARAGVAKATVFYHFGDRDGLLRAAAIEVVARLEDEIAASGAVDLERWLVGVLRAQVGPHGRLLYAIGDELALAGGLGESDPMPYVVARLRRLGVAHPEIVAAAAIEFGRRLARGEGGVAEADRLAGMLAATGVVRPDVDPSAHPRGQRPAG